MPQPAQPLPITLPGSWALLALPLAILCSAVSLVTLNEPTPDDVRRECTLAIDLSRQLGLGAVEGRLGANSLDAGLDCAAQFQSAGMAIVDFGPNFSRAKIHGDRGSIAIGYPVRMFGGHGDDLTAQRTPQGWRLTNVHRAWIS